MDDRNERETEEFIQRLVAAAPELTEEQVSNIRRLRLGDVPTRRRTRKQRPQATDLG
jgi:hypothetical protein